MLTILIATLITVNLGGLVLLYLQFRQAAREREAIGQMTATLYVAAAKTLGESNETIERLRTAHAQFQEDRVALLEALKAVNFLRPQLLQGLADDLLRGGPTR